MEQEKINIAELLKDCPKGMELNCAMFENLHFDYVENQDKTQCIYSIRCYVEDNGFRHLVRFTKYGESYAYNNAKCIIFPKGKTTWEGFVPPCEFKDGDILSYQHDSFKNRTIYIYMHHNRMNTSYYVALSGDSDSDFMINDKKGYTLNSYNDTVRFATEEEKERLFKAIKDNGYKWNAKTKTLEELIEPRFKVGDKIKHINSGKIATVVDVKKTHYNLDSKVGISAFTISLQHEWDLVSKFDINTLVPFDKVLVRFCTGDTWNIDFFGYYKKGIYNTNGFQYKQCIPYEGNQHLLGTQDDCSEYYKTWEE